MKNILLAIIAITAFSCNTVHVRRELGNPPAIFLHPCDCGAHRNFKLVHQGQSFYFAFWGNMTAEEAHSELIAFYAKDAQNNIVRFKNFTIVTVDRASKFVKDEDLKDIYNAFYGEQRFIQIYYWDTMYSDYNNIRILKNYQWPNTVKW